MVNAMYVAVDALKVHKPMCPIEIKVMKDYSDRKADEEIEQTVVGNILVDISIARFN